MTNQFFLRILLTLSILLVSFTSGLAQACMDFSGHFRSTLEDGTLLNLIATQKKCDQMILQYKYSDGVSFSKTMIFDGVSRVIFDEPNFKTIEAFLITDQELQFSAELHNKDTGSVNTLRGTFTLDEEGHLIENKTIYSLSGTPLLTIGIIHTRVPAL